MRYCATRFAHKVPTWSLPARGLGHDDGMLVRSDPSSPDSGRIGSRVGISGPRFQRVRLRRKTSVHEVFRESLGDHSRPRVWMRLKLGVSLVEEDDDAGGRQLHDHLDFGVLFMTGRELAQCHGVHERRLQVCTVFN